MVSIETLLLADANRMDLLRTVSSLNLPDWYIAAGFVRNRVWDHLHAMDNSPLNDIDVIYFDINGEVESSEIEQTLLKLRPKVNWQVKNQALMHRRNQDPPYKSSADAMTYWPEKETAVGVRLDNQYNLEVAAVFGTESLCAGRITHNPRRDISVFKHRVASKGWLSRWPQLTVHY